MKNFEMNHFSIDLETLGTRGDAAIVSIGVRQFNPDTGKLGDSFYRVIDLASSVKSGTITGSTLQWWMRQEDAARDVFQSPDSVPLACALDDLRAWMLKLSDRPVVWGFGATFDVSILEHAYDYGAVGLKEPWAFRDIRDMRTIVDEAQLDQWPPNVGVSHNALDDATYQATVISACRRKIRSALKLASSGDEL